MMKLYEEQRIIYVCLSLIAPDDMLTKTVNGLRGALTRIENEIKNHLQPKSANDRFGAVMTVSFSENNSKFNLIYLLLVSRLLK